MGIKIPMMGRPSYFVSGGAGFIGSRIVEHLMQNECKVTVYDNLSSGKIEHIENHMDKISFSFIHGDLLDPHKLNEAIKDHNFVFHLASNPDIAKSLKQPDLDLKQGIQATFNLLEAMLSEITPIFTADDSWDQRALVNWVNTHLQETDRIAASFPIIFKIEKGVGIPYQDVVLYTTHQSFYEYRVEMLPRYKINASLETIDYFITDTPINGFEPGKEMADTIKAQWSPIIKIGDYTIYRNPKPL